MRRQGNLSSPLFEGMGSYSDVVCSIYNQDIKKVWRNKLYFYDAPLVELKNFKEYMAGVSFDIITDETYFEKDIYHPTFEAKIEQGDEEILTKDIQDLNNPQIIKGLKIGSSGAVSILAKLDPAMPTSSLCRDFFRTIKPNNINIDYNSTQTTLTIRNITPFTDETYLGTTPVIQYFDGSSYQNFQGNEVVLKDLLPHSDIPVKVIYEGDVEVSRTLSTYDLSVYVNNKQEAPTSMKLEGEYNVGDAKFLKMEWKSGNEVVSTKPVYSLTGLKPNTEYKDLSFNVTTISKSGKTYTKTVQRTFKTSKLEMELMTPRSVSEKKTIVAAKTNIIDEEMNVGFQWKKYDAPESLAYSEATTAIYDGQIEGVLKNLQPTYYNVRAFYKDATGKYYYSEVTTFDPTDFSYFEPTVHTYPAEVEETGVQLLGYALEGTDDVISQGFEYWEQTENPEQISSRKLIAAEPEIKSVVAKGQRMTARLTDLKTGTDYCYRTFVETVSGRIYGEEQAFHTAGVASVDEVMAADSDVEIVGYYDISGRRYDEPRQGFNIVLYSDGTTKKMMFK